MATKTIGTGKDYSSPASYLTYLQTLGTLSAPEIGKQNNEELNVGSGIDFTGFTPTSTNTWTYEADTGASFKDNANKLTNALRYNASNGAAIIKTANYGGTLAVSVPYATIRNLQIGSTGNAGVLSSTFDVGNITFDNLILQGVGFNGGRTVVLGGNSDKLRNSVLILNSSNTQTPITVQRNGTVSFCTFVRPSNYSTGGHMVESDYGTATFNNCIWAGFNNTQDGGGFLSGSNNATTSASFPTGLSGQTSLTPATEFENPSNASSIMDFRLKSTSVKCKDNGSTDSTNGANDIVGTSRPQGSAYDIGAWELGSAGTTDTITKGDIALTGQAIGQAVKDPVTKADLAFVGKVVSDVVLDAVTKGDIAFVGKVIGETYTDPVTKGDLVFAGQSVSDTLTTTDTLTKGDLAFTGQSVGENVTDPITKGDLAFTGQSISETGNVTDTLAAGSITFAVQDIGENVTDPITKGDLALTGYDVGENITTLDLITSFAITLSGQTIGETITGSPFIPITPPTGLWEAIDGPDEVWTPINQGTRPWQTQ